MYFIKKFFNKNKTTKKDEKMSEFQNKNGLDYVTVIETIEIKDLKKLKNKLNSFKNNFDRLSNEQQQKELNSEDFKILSEKIISLKNRELNRLIDSMEAKRELSIEEKLLNELKEIEEKLNTIEKENLDSQSRDISDILCFIEDINKNINNSFLDKIKKNINIPEVNLSPITKEIKLIQNKIEELQKHEFKNIENSNQKINNNIKTITNKINDSNTQLLKKIDNIDFPKPPKIPNDYLKADDFDFSQKELKKDIVEIKEISENLETIPTKIINIEKDVKNISEKIDNLSNLSSKKDVEVYIPKEEQAVIDLAQYMKDGITQFEGIAKEYISKISELENLEKLKTQHKKELAATQKESFENGKKEAQIELIKNIAEAFPTKFKEIKSLFEEFITEKFQKDEIIEINDNNKNEIITFIENFSKNGKYKIISPAILLNNKILFKAEVVEKIEEKKVTNDKQESKIEEVKENKILDKKEDKIEKNENNNSLNETPSQQGE